MCLETFLFVEKQKKKQQKRKAKNQALHYLFLRSFLLLQMPDRRGYGGCSDECRDAFVSPIDIYHRSIDRVHFYAWR